MATTTWPFVGRDDLLERLITAVDSPHAHGSIISGAPGLGKTRLADELLARVNPRHRTARLAGSPGANNIPYAAVAHLLRTDAFDVASSSDPARVLAEVRQALAGPGRAVLMADDIAWIDDASISVIGQLLTLDEVFLVGTLRTGSAVSPALDALVRSFRIEYLHPAALTDVELVEAAERFLGASLDPRSADRIVNLCSGNPLYLRELLLHGQAAGHVTLWPSGYAWIEPDLSPAARLVEVVEERVRGIDPALGDLLRLMAVAEEATMGDLVRLGELDHAVELERQGWLRVDADRPDPVVRLAHPLHAEVLRTRMGELDQRRQLVRAVEMVSTRPVPLADDPLRVSIWRLDAGLPVDDPQILLNAARTAMAVFDLESTVRLARAVEQVDPTPESQYLAMNSLFLLGRFHECQELAARPLPEDLDVIGLLLHTSVHLYSILWGSCDAELAITELEKVRHRFEALGMGVLAEYLHGLFLANDGRFVEAMDLLGPSPSDQMLVFLSAVQRTTAQVRMGRAIAGREGADMARAFLEALPDSRSAMNPGFFALVQGASRTALGDADGALQLMTDAHVSAREDRVTFLRALLAVMLGETHLWQGNLDDAEVWYLDALDAAGSVGVRTALRAGTSGLASVAGQRDDAEAARKHLAALEELGDDLVFLAPETSIGRAWALHALGEPEEARDTIRQAADAAQDRHEWFGVARLALEGSRLGHHRWAAELFDSVPDLDGPLVECWRTFCGAFRGRTPERFADAHHRAVAVGAHLLAAEAAAGWAESLRRGGDGRAASAAAAAANRSAEMCTGAATPLLSVSSPVVLSRREREIGELAADGLSNVEIAERLYLSRRTVENHLQRVYVKLGVASRQDLRAAL